jgi:hypothetical protein
MVIRMTCDHDKGFRVTHGAQYDISRSYRLGSEQEANYKTNKMNTIERIEYLLVGIAVGQINSNGYATAVCMLLAMALGAIRIYLE